MFCSGRFAIAYGLSISVSAENRPEASGFTLIELAIVLVIIGLIVGGILVGRDLIHQAEIRATIAQADQFNTAVNAFRAKFNCLPGDCINAGAFGFNDTCPPAVPNCTNGNGDGLIGPCVYDDVICTNLIVQSAVQHEQVDAWYHLSRAGLIPHSLKDAQSQLASGAYQVAGVATPPSRIMARQAIGGPLRWPSGWAIRTDIVHTWGPVWTNTVGYALSPAHHLVLTQRSLDSGSDTAYYAISDMEAIDRKLDDGLPLSGSVRAWKYFIVPSPQGGRVAAFVDISVPPVTGTCATNDIPPRYVVAKEFLVPDNYCSVIIKAAF